MNCGLENLSPTTRRPGLYLPIRQTHEPGRNHLPGVWQIAASILRRLTALRFAFPCGRKYSQAHRAECCGVVIAQRFCSVNTTERK